MAIPLLAQLGIALLSKQMQDNESSRQSAYERAEANKRKQAQLRIDFLNRPAARAGERGYSVDSPVDQLWQSDAGGMITDLGMALLSRKDQPEDEGYGYGTRSGAHAKLRRSEF
jgi:hypothetical protein